MDVDGIRESINLTGPISPNIPILEGIFKLADLFRHDHSDLTEDDSIIILSSVTVGRTKINTSGNMVTGNISGCHNHLSHMIAGFIKRNPDFLDILNDAIEEFKKGDVNFKDEQILNEYMVKNAIKE